MAIKELVRSGTSRTAGIDTVVREKKILHADLTSADNMGMRHEFVMENDAGHERTFAAIDVIALDVSDATEDAQLIIRLPVAGVLTEMFRIDTTGYRLPDSRSLSFGDADDVSVQWNGTNLLVRPVSDDTGQIRFGDGTTDMDVRVTLGVAADYVQLDVGAKALQLAGDVRIDLSSATIAAANTDGGLVKAGTSAARVIEDTANMKFMSFYFDDGAASGSAEGLYLRLYATGAGTMTANAGRIFCTVEDVAIANARGAHISLSFGAAAGGSVSGLGAAVDATLHIPNAVMAAAGTYAAVSADINADGVNSDPSGVAELSAIRVALQGNATGVGRIDDKAYLLVLNGGAIGGGNIVEASTTEANYAYSIRVKVNGTVMYLMAASAVG